MHALIICEEARLAELLTVAMRQVGMRGMVRRTPPSSTTQIEDAAVVLLDALDVDAALDGLEALRAITPSPILIMCPRADEEAVLEIYRRGATIVVIKPHDLRIVAAQTAALARLVAAATLTPTTHPFLDPDTQSITLPEGRVRLTTLEYRLVAVLLSRPGRVFPPNALVENVWGYSGAGDRHLVKGLVNRVRRKIEPSPQKPIYLVTEVGVGYRFNPPGEVELQS